MVIDTESGAELHFHKLWAGASGHVNRTPETPREGRLEVPKLLSGHVSSGLSVAASGSIKQQYRLNNTLNNFVFGLFLWA